MTRLKDEVDDTIDPGDDFYAYVNNKWLTAHPIPDNKAHIGAMSVLSDQNLDRMQKLLASPVRSTDSQGIQAVKHMYAAGMNTEAIERDGLGLLEKLLSQSRSLTNKAAVVRYLIRLHASGSALLWHPHLDIDDKDSQTYCLRISQSGLGLPDRDYYFETDEKFESIRASYIGYLTSLLKLLGETQAERKAKLVYNLEKKLARVSDTALQRRDVEGSYNPYTLSEMKTRFPGIDWDDYLQQLTIPRDLTMVVSQPKFLSASLRLLKQEPLESLQLYCLVRTINPLMMFLPKAYDLLYFDFYGKKLAGALKQEKRSRRVIALCMSMLPEPTGQLFVETYFDQTAKARITELVDYITDALRDRIKKLDWMSEITKRRAFKKLDTFLPLLGYPESWRDYRGLKLGPSFADNVLVTKAFEWTYDAQRSNKPVDRKEWLMSPAMVNAYYWPNTNGITFPAGILQPPLFDANGDFAANFGGIGIVIGHEITHGFDDKGALYNEFGKLQSWWKPNDWKAFETRANRLAKQYDSYKVEGRPVNGELTLGENISDLGGTLLSLDAMYRYMEKTDAHASVDGFTPEQRFFMSLARIWRENMRPELTLSLLVANPHSPSKLRVNGVVPNVNAFYEAFNVTPAAKLYVSPKKRTSIW